MTDYAGPASELGVMVWDATRLDVAKVADLHDPANWVAGIMKSTLPMSAQLRALIFRFVPLPPGVDADDFLECAWCYHEQVDAPDFDAEMATAALDAEILQPMAAQQGRLDAAAVVTRLFTTMDPEEMTADPTFVFNADLPQSVANTHTATDTTDTTDDRQVRTLELSDGRNYRMADPEQPSMEDFDSPTALVIEDLGATGLGKTVFDGTADAVALADASHCGCAGGSAVAPFVLLAVGVLGRRRR